MLRTPSPNLLACPNCQATVSAGLNVTEQSCSACGQRFFDLSGMPCWFDTGLEQQRLWESLYGLTMRSAEKNLQAEAERDLRKVMASTRERLEKAAQVNQAIVHSVDDLLGGIGLSKTVHSGFEKYDPSRMLQYFELLLRDWAWDAELPLEQSENQRELERVKAALAATGRDLGNVWVIGCGAGRLSLDMHIQLNAKATVAMDTNPVLMASAQRLVVQQQAWQLAEQHAGPQRGYPRAKIWDIQSPKVTAEDIEHWYLMAGNAWRPALKPASFDTIVTPWFMDVNGRDAGALIGLVQRYLKPGGLWLNTGPLLYNPDVAEEHRYSHEEIVELAELAGFNFHYQNSVASEYLNTPLAQEQRVDQVWTFAAIAPAEGHIYPAVEPPAWITLPHLAIPATTPLNSHGNPVLEHLAAQVNGDNSINDIADMMRANLGEDKDPVEVVTTAFIEYLLNPDL